MIRHLTRLATSVAMLLAVMGCTALADDDDAAKPWDRLIPEESYRLSDVRCESQPGRTNVDGEIVDDTHWIATGTLHNLLTTSSPNYRLVATVTYSNGEVRDTTGTLFRSVRPRSSAEFRIVAGGEAQRDGSSATDCQVAVFDSVLNYVD